VRDMINLLEILTDYYFKIREFLSDDSAAIKVARFV
jgi:hypothetical protein